MKYSSSSGEKVIKSHGIIYRIANLINGKKYIGQTTCKDATQRWKGHQKAFAQGRGCPFLRQAVEKYGIANFTFEVILECSDDERHEKEKELIISEKALLPFGYNMLLGGNDGFFKKHHTAEARKKISEASKIASAKRSEEEKREIKKKISEANIKAKANGSAETRAKISKKRKGVKLSESTREKIRKGLLAYHSKDNSNPSKKISEETRRKISEAAKMRKQNGTTAKFTEEMKKYHSEVMTRVRGIKIDQHRLDGVFIQTFASGKDAAKSLGISHDAIYKALSGKHKTAGGFIWKQHYAIATPGAEPETSSAQDI